MNTYLHGKPPRLTFYQDETGLWRWRVYSDSGEIISQSLQGHEHYTGAQRDAGKTMEAIIRITNEHIASESGHMKYAVAVLATYTIRLSAELEKLGLTTRPEAGITHKMMNLVDEVNHEEFEESEAKQADSIYTPRITVSTPIPVQYIDMPQIVQVRVK